MNIIYVLVFMFKLVNLSDVTYYEILGINKQATSQDIRQAYKKLAVKLHPDKNPNAEDQEMFIKITEAYETLKDPERKRKYDLYGIYPSYTRKYDYQSQSEYNNLYYNGLYHGDEFVDTVTGSGFASYLSEGFYFMNFYSPFCPPCQNLAELWKKLAELYKGIVKIGAVNCKYHNNFCYNSMRITSYPTLLFYPNGKRGNFMQYRGDRTLEALDQFLMSHLSTQVHVPTHTVLHLPPRPADASTAYVLGAETLHKHALYRIAYHLKGLVSLVVVEEEEEEDAALRSRLTSNQYATVVFKHNDIHKDIESSDERELLNEIVLALPRIQLIHPDRLKDIRNQLRNGDVTPCVLYFTSKHDAAADRVHQLLLLHQMRVTFPDMHFGEVECDAWPQLCLSLQVGVGGEATPAWGVLKRGGAYQRAPGRDARDVRAFLRDAPRALAVHTLSPSELERVLAGDHGTWVLLVIPLPHQSSWSELSDAITRSGLHFSESTDVHFGIMSCTLDNEAYCLRVVAGLHQHQQQPLVVVQNGTRRHPYSGQITQQHLIEFIDTLADDALYQLKESEVLEIVSASTRAHAWVVAHLPSAAAGGGGGGCGALCAQLAHQFRIVASKLRPLEWVRVGVQQCAPHEGGFCNNIRTPTARVYPLASTTTPHYTVSLQHVSQAPYILEWALDRVDDTVQELNWNTFSKQVVAEELHLTSSKKPWLVYFHSPRCYRCYEMYADFAIAGILSNKAVRVGKVNCVTERGLCQHEQIHNYPTMRLYLSRGEGRAFSNVLSIPVQEHHAIVKQVLAHLRRHHRDLLADVEIDFKQHFQMKHDEF